MTMRVQTGRFLAAADEMMGGTGGAYHFAYVDYDGRPAMSCELSGGRIPVNVEIEPWINEFRNYKVKIAALDILDRLAKVYGDSLTVTARA